MRRKHNSTPKSLFIFGLVWTAFSSIFLVIGLMSVVGGINRSGWRETPCQIGKFEITDDPGKDSPFETKVEYTYDWEGNSYTGENLRANDNADDNYEALGELLDQYRNGELTVCFVNPDSPGESVLVPISEDFWGGLAFAFAGGCFVAIGIGLIIASRKQKAFLTGQIPPPKEKGGNAPRAVLIPVFTFFGLAGFGVLFGVVIPQWNKFGEAKSWKATPGEVIWSRVKTHRGDDGTTYSADIFYQYEFNGREYKSNTVDLMSGSSSGRSSKQEKVDDHPPGTEITCYVNPEKPWQALLERDLGWWALFALFPLPFIAVGIFGWWYLLRRGREEDETESKRSNPRRLRSRNPN